MLLTIDAGNTRTKWAIFNPKGEISHQNACLNADFASADLSECLVLQPELVISNVTGEHHALIIQQKFSKFNLKTHWIQATAHACNVVNHYLPPHTLGTDRWASMIAAWQLQAEACIVVNAGTAVTIDAILPTAHRKTGAFIGGAILPGIDLMQHSLGLATAQLPHAVANHTKGLAPSIFGKTTSEAIYTGALHAICGAITNMADTLANTCKQAPIIILSGGNADEILSALTKQPSHVMSKQVIIVDSLVLKGLYCLSKQL